MSILVHLTNSKGIFRVNGTDNSDIDNSEVILSNDDDDKRLFKVYQMNGISLINTTNTNNNNNTSNNHDFIYMYIDSRIDNNIILMTVNSLKIVCNARFLEIYVNTNINANTNGNYEYMKTVRGSNTTNSNIFTCTVNDINTTKIASIKIKFLSVKNTNNTPIVTIYDIESIIDFDDKDKKQLKTIIPDNINNSTNDSTNDTNNTNDNSNNNTQSINNINMNSTISPHVLMTYFNELERIIDMKLSPIINRLDNIEKDIVYLKTKI